MNLRFESPAGGVIRPIISAMLAWWGPEGADIPELADDVAAADEERSLAADFEDDVDLERLFLLQPPPTGTLRRAPPRVQ